MFRFKLPCFLKIAIISWRIALKSPCPDIHHLFHLHYLVPNDIFFINWKIISIAYSQLAMKAYLKVSLLVLIIPLLKIRLNVACVEGTHYLKQYDKGEFILHKYKIKNYSFWHCKSCGQRQLSGNDFHIFFTLDARFPVTAPSHNDHNQASATVEESCQ